MERLSKSKGFQKAIKNKARAEIFIEGIVQGVGYRFFAEDKAALLSLDGYVMNLPDGRVKVEVEGDREAIEKYIDELRRGPRMARVSDVEVIWGDYLGEFKGFQIRHSFSRW